MTFQIEIYKIYLVYYSTSVEYIWTFKTIILTLDIHIHCGDSPVFSFIRINYSKKNPRGQNKKKYRKQKRDLEREKKKTEITAISPEKGCRPAETT